MIDYKQLIIDHTNLLYQEGAKPSYSEFRDMFSRGQLESKEDLVNFIDRDTPYWSKIIIVGGWYGLLASILKDRYYVSVLELDSNCVEHNRRLSGVVSFSGDMFDYKYSDYDTIINTACEHVDYCKWLSQLPKGKRVIIQNTNYKEPEDHTNTVNNLDEFRGSVKLLIKECDSTETKIAGLYNRFTICGVVV